MPIVIMFFTAVFMILYQRNGEVINHHIPMVCLKAILCVLFIKEVATYLMNLLIKKFQPLIMPFYGIYLK